MLLIIALWVGIAAAAGGPSCSHGPLLNLPSCTQECIAFQVIGNVCANNLAGLCDMQDGVNKWAIKFGACMESQCGAGNGQDIYDTFNTMRVQCEGHPYWPDKIDGNLDSWFQSAPQYSSSANTAAAASSTVDSTSQDPSTSPATSGGTPGKASTEPTTSETITAEISTSIAASSNPGPSPSTQDSSKQDSSKSGEAPSQSTQGLPKSSNAPSPIVVTEHSTTIVNGMPTMVLATHIASFAMPNDASARSQTTFATTTKLASSPTSSAAPAAPAISTPALAGTVAGGTAGLALLVSLVYIFVWHRKRHASRASSADIWEPTRNTHNDKSTLPIVGSPELDSNTTFGRYSEVRPNHPVDAPMRQLSKAELHTTLSPHPQLTPPPRISFKVPGEQGRSYHPSQRPEQHRQASNIDSRYPTLSSPTSPVSDTSASTMQGWPPSGVPIKLSHPDLRGAGVRSPVSELGGNGSVRKVRSAELYGAEVMSPVSELGSDGGFMGGSAHGNSNGSEAVESGGDTTKGVVEMEGSTVHKLYRGVSTNF